MDWRVNTARDTPPWHQGADFVLDDGLLSETRSLHALSGESVRARLGSLYSNSEREALAG